MLTIDFKMRYLCGFSFMR